MTNDQGWKLATLGTIIKQLGHEKVLGKNAVISEKKLMKFNVILPYLYQQLKAKIPVTLNA